MFKFIKSEPSTPADKRIQQVIDKLFPPLKLHVDDNGIKYHIDYGADANLDAVLNDLEDGYNDKATQKTVRDIANRLVEVRKMLEAYNQVDEDAKYYVVDSDIEVMNSEEIQAKEDQI
jgi:hypothetical protein